MEWTWVPNITEVKMRKRRPSKHKSMRRMTVAGGEKELHSGGRRNVEEEKWRGKKRGPYEELLYITIKQAAMLQWQLVCSTTERMQRVQTIWSMGALSPPITRWGCCRKGTTQDQEVQMGLLSRIGDHVPISLLWQPTCVLYCWFKRLLGCCMECSIVMYLCI